LKINDDTVFWIPVKNKKKLAALNNTSINEVYDEKLIEINGKQYNLWT
tara:strand:- start:231 stop:374 length:144 start_codon:yes stop_codon:yes gene_type:complete